MRFGEWMRQERTQKHITQAELASMVRVSVASICAYEHGRWNPSKATQRKIIAALNAAKDRLDMPVSPAATHAKMIVVIGNSNGDQLRGMLDEELVFKINCPKTGCQIPQNNRDCYQCKLDWLKAEAKQEQEAVL